MVLKPKILFWKKNNSIYSRWKKAADFMIYEICGSICRKHLFYLKRTLKK